MNNKNPVDSRVFTNKNNSESIMTIKAPSAITIFVTTLEQFFSKIETFLDNHYEYGSESEDIQKMLKEIDGLRFEIDRERLEKEFDLVQERRDYLSGKDF